MTEEQFKEAFKVRFRSGPRGKSTVHYVVEVDPQLRKTVLRQGRIYVGFRSLSIKDYIVVSTCNKCYDLGHIAKYCPHREESCGHCGKDGHSKPDCPAKDRPRTCIPCLRRGKQCHKEKGQCLTYKMLVDRLIERTDYGN